MNATSVRLLALVAAALHFGTGQPDPARAAEPAAAQLPDARALTLEFIDTAIAERRLKAAAELIRRAEGRVPAPELALRAAELLLAGGATADAATALKALEADQTVGPRAQAARAVAAYRTGQMEQAETLAAAATARDPALVRAWSLRAVLADRRADWAAADSHHARALALAPEDAGIRNNRGWSLLLRGQHAPAEAEFEAALKAEPRLAAAANNLKLARALQGRYAEAFTSANAQELARDLNTVGVAAMLRGDHRIAEGYFARAIDMNGRYDRTAAANLAYLRAIAPELQAGQ